jgi:hypothetical protein
MTSCRIYENSSLEDGAMTTESNQRPDYPHDYPSNADEINLIDYLRVIWKWKWPIVAGTLVCVGAAAVISLQVPKIYEVSTTIDLGVADVKDDGMFTPIESATNLCAKIQEGVYNSGIREALAPDRIEMSINFTSSIIAGADAIKITSEWVEGETDVGLKATHQLIQLIADDYEKKLALRKDYYDKQIASKRSEIDKLRQQQKNIDNQTKFKLADVKAKKDLIELKKKTLAHITKRKETITSMIQVTQSNNKKIAERVDTFLKGNQSDKELSLPDFWGAMQQNMAYLNGLTGQLYDLENEEQEIGYEIKMINRDIDTVKMEAERLRLLQTEELRTNISNAEALIEELQSKKNMLRNVAYINPPEVSPHPVKQRTEQTTLLAGAVALCFFVFLAFFIEAMKRYSPREKREV